MKVFKYDTVKLILNTGKDVSTFTTKRIKYESPSGVRGNWTAAICPSSVLCIQATVQFDEKGIWKVQAYVAKSGPQRYHGKLADVRVFDAVSEFTTAPPTTTLTTVPPTTAAPTTSAPTTSAATTSAPSTAPPTTVAPTT